MSELLLLDDTDDVDDDPSLLVDVDEAASTLNESVSKIEPFSIICTLPKYTLPFVRYTA